MGGYSMGLTGLETPSATRLGGPTSSANLLVEGDRPGPTGMGTPVTPAEELNSGGVVDATKILNYASSNQGKRVGKGECFDLADLALKGAGAKSAADFGSIAADADYIWGTPKKKSEVQPGDIVQFLGYAYDIKSTKVTPRVYDDGKPVLDKDGKPTFDTETIDGDADERPHHTAIVKSVGSNGVITVWEQNVPTGGSVRSFDLYFENTTIDKGNSTTWKVTVTGKFTFYRPEPRS